MIKFKELRTKLAEEATDGIEGGKGGGGGGGNMMQPGLNRPQIDREVKAIYSIENEETRRAINALLASEMNERAYVDPKSALVAIRTKLNIVGLNFDFKPSAIETTIPTEGDSDGMQEGTVEEYDLMGFGGMQGMNMDGQFVKDDGIAYRAGTPMVLRVEYTEGINRLCHLNAEIVPKSGMEDVED
tara:strand:+ start:1316 stop:1873 length:558 start_codon:yes stop_codon:yes gene_type:complete